MARAIGRLSSKEITVVTLAPKTATNEERQEILRLATKIHAEICMEMTTLGINDNPGAAYALISEGDSFVVPADPDNDQEHLELLAQIRRVVANTKPSTVITTWPAWSNASSEAQPGGEPMEVMLIQIEGMTGTLAIGHAKIDRKTRRKHPSLGPLQLEVFESTDCKVELKHGGGVYLDLWRGRSTARVH